MTTALRLLAASVILGLVHLIAASHLISLQHGYPWTASSREEPTPPLRGLANRVDQATNEFSGNLSLVRDCSSCSAYHESAQLAYALRCASLLLGARRIFARSAGRIQSCAFGSLLEYSGYGYIAFPHCASLVVI